MGSLAKGAKAGVIAGAAYGILVALLIYATLSVMKDSVMPLFAQYMPQNAPFTIDQLYSLALIVAPVIMFAIGVVGGILLGAIYGWLFERIPGRNSATRGVVFSLMFWVIFSVLGGLGDLQYSLEYYGVQLAMGFFTALVFGLLLGHFYGRFTASLPQNEEQL